jgi:hydrogenase maturation protease
MRHSRSRILVLGLGNSILRDDGAGVHAVRRFQQLTPLPCLAVEVGTAVLNAVHLIENADRVLAFDAVKAGGEPGSVYLFRAEDAMSENAPCSLHEIGLIRVLQTLTRRPAEVLIIGVEPQIIDWGTELSPAVESAVPSMISVAQKAIGGRSVL